MNDDRINVDRMRYTKNTSSSRLCYLAILFNVLYFISLYKLDIYELRILPNGTGLNNAYYTAVLGGSIILNLVFMLLTFLASESVKNYKKGYSWMLIALGVVQLLRIFGLPFLGIASFPGTLHDTFLYVREGRHFEDVTFPLLGMSFTGTRKVTFMSDWQFIRICIYLVASAVCLFISAHINTKKSSLLAAHIENLETLQA